MVQSTRGLKGAQEAKDILRELADEIREGGEVTGPSLDEATDAMMDLIDAKTPVRTGELREGNDKRMLDNKRVEIFNEVEYAGYVHNGTSRMPPRKFMEDGINELQNLLPQIHSTNASEFLRKLESKHAT